jgi:transcriptional antiterminator RfaH
MAATVAELRARAALAHVSIGEALRADRLRDERVTLARMRASWRRRGELVEPRTVDVAGVVWRVVVTTAADAFGVAADLAGLGWRAYAPAGRLVVYRGRAANGLRTRRIEAYPLFGGYLFVGETDAPVTRATHDRILAVLGDARGPLAVAPAVIAAINAAERAGRWDATQPHARRSPFSAGDAVRIADGPLAAFRAVVEGVEASGRIRVACQMFGGVTTVRVESDQLRPIAEKAA